MGKEDDIESLIAITITHIKTALDSNKPGEVKLYAAALVLLRQAQSISSVNWLPKKDKTFDKPFEKISEKHIPVVKTQTEIDEMKTRPDYLNIANV